MRGDAVPNLTALVRRGAESMQSAEHVGILVVTDAGTPELGGKKGPWIQTIANALTVKSTDEPFSLEQPRKRGILGPSDDPKDVALGSYPLTWSEEDLETALFNIGPGLMQIANECPAAEERKSYEQKRGVVDWSFRWKPGPRREKTREDFLQLLRSASDDIRLLYALQRAFENNTLTEDIVWVAVGAYLVLALLYAQTLRKNRTPRKDKKLLQLVKDVFDKLDRFSQMDLFFLRNLLLQGLQYMRSLADELVWDKINLREKDLDFERAMKRALRLNYGTYF